MRRLRLFWRIYATYLMLVVLCALALGFFAASSARSFYRSHAQTGLQAMAALVAEQVRPMLGEASARSLDALVKQLGAASGTRLTLIATGAQEGAAGVVLADSEVALGDGQSQRQAGVPRRGSRRRGQRHALQHDAQ